LEEILFTKAYFLLIALTNCWTGKLFHFQKAIFDLNVFCGPVYELFIMNSMLWLLTISSWWALVVWKKWASSCDIQEVIVRPWHPLWKIRTGSRRKLRKIRFWTYAWSSEERVYTGSSGWLDGGWRCKMHAAQRTYCSWNIPQACKTSVHKIMSTLTLQCNFWTARKNLATFTGTCVSLHTCRTQLWNKLAAMIGGLILYTRCISWSSRFPIAE